MKKQLICVLAVCLVIATSGTAIWLSRSGGEQAGKHIAYVYSDNKLVRTVDLDKESPSQFRVEAPDGGYNLIEVRDGAIGVVEADCDDHVCEHTGFIRSSELPIVCMPHGLVIRVDVESEDGVDTVAQ